MPDLARLLISRFGVDLHTAAPCLIRSPRVARILRARSVPVESLAGYRSKQLRCNKFPNGKAAPRGGLFAEGTPKGPQTQRTSHDRDGIRIL